ncbi:Multidrug resistance-associated protein 1 [Blyttiomyces sp. JEL0837]|nr:Multidrug resistance-associated protein 1 [Blyttiomyces sp. JEL0837]
MNDPAGQSKDYLNAGVNPEASASWIERILFTYMNSLLVTGFKRPLQAGDVYDLMDSDKAETVTERFHEAWNKELSKAKKLSIETGKPVSSFRPHLKTLRAVYLPYFLAAAVPRFLADTFSVVSPIVLLILINYLSNVRNGSPDNGWEGYVLAVALFVIQALQVVLILTHIKACSKIGYYLRTALISASFRKMLKLSPSVRSALTTGKIINVIVSDTNRLDLAAQNISNIYSAPYVIIVATSVLIYNLGPSALIGLAVLVAFIPIQNIIQKTMGKMRSQANIYADRRIKVTSEALSGIRVIKSYAWEQSFQDVISGLRVKELSFQRIFLLLRSSISGMSLIVPALAMIATFVSFHALGNELVPSQVFSSLSLFYVLRSPLLMLPLTISQATDAWISVHRLEEVLIAEELTNGPRLLPSPDPKNPDEANLPAVEFQNASFTWESARADVSIPSPNEKSKNNNNNDIKNNDQKGDEIVELETRENAVFQFDNVDISIKRGALVAIVGPVGSGKSSLLQALVGEMKRTKGDVVIRGSLGWCPQSALIFNQTVRENILFGKEFDEKRYSEVIVNCALEADLRILGAGDQTEIGERGVNISGGQRQRISLARAVYVDSDIILLDDPLSAVDAHVGRYLFEKCITGVLSSKTRVLVTHQLHFLPSVDRVIVVNSGKIVEDGTYDELMHIEGGVLQRMMREFGGTSEESDEEPSDGVKTEKDPAVVNETDNKLTSEPDKQSDENLKATNDAVVNLSDKSKPVENVEVEAAKKLMQKEERNVGGVTASLYTSYLRLGGGAKMALLIVLGALASQVSRVMTDNWLAFWSYRRYANLSDADYEGTYVALGLAQTVFLAVFSVSLVFTGLWSSQSLHELGIASVLNAPLSFFDTTPLGRLITRFSRDVDMCDSTLPETFRTFIFTLSMTLTNFGLIAAIFPAFLAGLIPSLVLYVYFQRYYSSSSRELRRLDSITRSPLFAHVSETLAGISTVRAYARQDMFTKRNVELLNNNGRMYYASIMVPLWLSIRLESISAILIFLAALFAIIGRYNTPPGLAGLTISYAITITSVFNWCVRQSAEVEQNMNSVERMLYLSSDIDQETQIKKLIASDPSSTTNPSEQKSKPQQQSEPNPNWPTSGSISFRDVRMRYRPELPLVLQGISFDIDSGEKIGIIGRTGAGTSSIIMALLRLVECEDGAIFIDNVDIATVSLRFLRSKIAVIPQEPVLFSGTVRSNLDPFSQYKDDDLWNAIRDSNLSDTVAATGMGLDAVVAENGENFSTGQRQLICLARAMLRAAKLIILDEATASVDLETDEFIQKAIRTKFSQATVVTIAHRLNTVADYTKILVLSQGTVLESGSPKELLGNPEGAFSKMVEETGPVNASAIRELAGASI